MTLKLIVIASLNRILPLLTVTADAVLSFQIGVSLSFQPLPFFFGSLGFAYIQTELHFISTGLMGVEAYACMSFQMSNSGSCEAEMPPLIPLHLQTTCPS